MNSKLEKTEEKLSRDSLIILCEGETEEVYIRSLALHLGIAQRVIVRTNKNDSSPLGLVRECAKELSFDDATGRKLVGAWTVFDRDQHTNYREAFEYAKKFPRINIAWSNPCFEIWLLMHFAKLPAGMNRIEEIVQLVEESTENESTYKSVIHITKTVEKLYSPTQCQKTLKVYWPGYRKKGRDYLVVTGSKVGVALREKSKFTSDPENLGSNFGSLMKCLLKMAGKSVDEAFGEFKNCPVDVQTPVPIVDEPTEEVRTNLTIELLDQTVQYLLALKNSKILSKNVTGKLDKLQERLLNLHKISLVVKDESSLDKEVGSIAIDSKSFAM